MHVHVHVNDEIHDTIMYMQCTCVYIITNDSHDSMP